MHEKGDGVVMTRIMIEQAMGFYMAAGLCMIMLPGMLIQSDVSGNVLRLRRVGQIVMATSMVMLTLVLMQSPV